LEVQQRVFYVAVASEWSKSEEKKKRDAMLLLLRALKTKENGFLWNGTLM
jgi:hypothetical protein